MKTTQVAIGDIKPNPDNPRHITDAKFKKLVASIRDFPQMLELRPIVVDSDGMILGGNMRLRACKEAGLKEVPVIYADQLTEEQKREFIIKDNVGFGEWDWDVLANEWDEVVLDAWGLDVPGFDIEEEPEVTEDNYEVPDEITTDIVPGDLFKIGPHRLLCGDSTKTDEWQKVFGNELADLIITDPPYNVDYASKNEALNAVGKGNRIQTDIANDNKSDSDFDQFLLDFFTSLGSFTKLGGSWYVWSPPGITETQFRNQFTASGLLLKQCLIWVKNVMVIGRQDYQWKHESCLYGWKPGAGHYFIADRTKTTVIEDTVDIKKLNKAELFNMLQKILSDKIPTTVLKADKPIKSELHPTMKPVLLISPLIQNSSKSGELVADGFLGSGTTMVAAHQLDRRCYGMELDPKYCQVILDRMLTLDPTLEIKRNGKPYATQRHGTEKGIDA
jgi:DNA modification methylase